MYCSLITIVEEMVGSGCTESKMQAHLQPWSNESMQKKVMLHNFDSFNKNAASPTECMHEM